MPYGINYVHPVQSVTYANHLADSLDQLFSVAQTPVEEQQQKVNDALADDKPEQKSVQEPDQSLLLSEGQPGSADGEDTASKPPGTDQPLESVQGNASQMNSNNLDVSVSESMDQVFLCLSVMICMSLISIPLTFVSKFTCNVFRSLT